MVLDGLVSPGLWVKKAYISATETVPSGLGPVHVCVTRPVPRLPAVQVQASVDGTVAVC